MDQDGIQKEIKKDQACEEAWIFMDSCKISVEIVIFTLT